MRAVGVVLIAIGAGALAYWSVLGFGNQMTQTSAGRGAALVSIKLPEAFSSSAQIGQTAFDAECSVCHGANATGQEGFCQRKPA